MILDLDTMLCLETAAELLEEAEQADFDFVDPLLPDEYCCNYDTKDADFEFNFEEDEDDEEESPYV
jgi:hypothetical protein